MKRYFLFLVGLIAMITATAQTTLMATLSHEGNISTFYGANALKEAYDAAENNDVITLSSGQFNAISISKTLTIRGAGCDFNSDSGSQPTIIAGDFTLSGDINITFEGIYSNSAIQAYGLYGNLQLIKCRLNKFYAHTNSPGSIKANIINCRVTDHLDISSNTAQIINSIINNPCNDSYGSFQFNNCFVHISSNGYTTNSNYTNCFVYCSTTGDYLPRSNIANYCVGFQSNTFDGQPSKTNKIASGTDIFESFDAACSDGATYRLTEAAKNQFKGSDGKEVGIYGGSLPFNTIPNTPQISKFNVAEKSTADGKLSIDISVAMPE